MPNEEPQVKRIYKDSVFRMLFKEKSELLSLYNALYGTQYDDPEQLEITTLENAIYMNLKNDVSCILDYHLSLLEHQTTFNPNMPLRYLMYVADLYQKLTVELDIYSSKQITLPNPSFVVLYNGEKEQPKRRVLRLSDAYSRKGEGSTELELTVLQLNINEGYNQNIVTRCPALCGYVKFVTRVRENRKTMPVSEAVDHAVKSCIRDGILEDFLRKNRAEVVKMSIYEYDEEKHFKTLREEGREEGRIEGREEGRVEGREEGLKEGIYRMFRKQRTPEEINEFTGEPLEYLYEVQKEYLSMVREETSYDKPMK